MNRAEFYSRFKNHIAVKHPLPIETSIQYAESPLQIPQDPFIFEDSFSEGLYQGFLLGRQSLPFKTE